MSNVYHKLSGTMSDSFAIGKNGPAIVRGIGLPTQFIQVPDGSFYISDTGAAYKKAGDSWFQLVTIDMLKTNSYRTSIEYGELDETSSFIVTHNLNEKYVLVQCYTMDGDTILPDSIHLVDENSFQVTLSSFVSPDMSVNVCVKA